MSDNLSFYIICGGFNSISITNNFVAYLTTINNINKENTLIIPSDRILPYDGFNTYKYLRKNLDNLSKNNLTFITFSAGVIGGIIAGNLWQKQGGKVNSLWAFDGWGVPLMAKFPCYRISHDYITHLSYFGGEKNAFYASPSVSHLQLWEYPEVIEGWWEITLGIKKRSNLKTFLTNYIGRQNEE